MHLFYVYRNPMAPPKPFKTDKLNQDHRIREKKVQKYGSILPPVMIGERNQSHRQSNIIQSSKAMYSVLETAKH